MSVKYTLKYPIEWPKGETVTEITLARPKMKNFKKMGTDPSVEDMMKLAAAVSGFPPPFFDELDALDGIKISEILGGFLEESQETGDK